MWPVAWTARGDGASSFNDRCVRVLYTSSQVVKVPFAEYDNLVDALAPGGGAVVAEEAAGGSRSGAKVVSHARYARSGWPRLRC
jgi:hypothetical protein